MVPGQSRTVCNLPSTPIHQRFHKMYVCALGEYANVPYYMHDMTKLICLDDYSKYKLLSLNTYLRLMRKSIGDCRKRSKPKYISIRNQVGSIFRFVKVKVV